MAKETTAARETKVMGLRSRNAVSGRTDRAMGRPTYPSLNKTFSARVERDSSDGTWDRLHEELGNGFFHPTYAFQAEEYEKATGKSLPKDAVSVVFGRGAANGTDFNDVMEQSKYSHIKVLKANTRYGYETYLSGYRNAAEIRSLLDEVRSYQREKSFERTTKMWNKRRGRINGF